MPRERLPPPQHPDDAANVTTDRHEVFLRHPGYESSVPLLILPAHDRSGKLHHETARLACAAVACNRDDGFLSLDRDGSQPVGADPDLELDAGEYWFQVPKEAQNVHVESGSCKIELDRQYPIFPDAFHWQFMALPDYWKRASIDLSHAPPPRESTPKDSVRERVKSCRVTGNAAMAEVAHIIPHKMREWFDVRGMAVFDDFGSPSNAILLRPDVHQLLDSKHFAFIPRTLHGRLDGARSVIVAYVFKRDCLPEVVEMYHDVEPQPLSGIRLEFLFCRFIYTIFEALRPFMRQGLRRWLKVNVQGNDYQTKLCSSAESKEYASQSRSRPPSPQKRQRAESSQGIVDDCSGYDTKRKRTSSVSSTDSNECGRGRKRYRSFSPDNSALYGSMSSTLTSVTDVSEGLQNKYDSWEPLATEVELQHPHKF